MRLVQVVFNMKEVKIRQTAYWPFQKCCAHFFPGDTNDCSIFSCQKPTLKYRAASGESLAFPFLISKLPSGLCSYFQLIFFFHNILGDRIVAFALPKEPCSEKPSGPLCCHGDPVCPGSPALSACFSSSICPILHPRSQTADPSLANGASGALGGEL